jgi:hypothetical protein
LALHEELVAAVACDASLLQLALAQRHAQIRDGGDGGVHGTDEEHHDGVGRVSELDVTNMKWGKNAAHLELSASKPNEPHTKTAVDTHRM